MADKSRIKEWLDRGVQNGATHVVVACDTFSHEYYPVFVQPDEDAREIADKYDGKNMQKLMEVYNLSQDIQQQLDTYCVLNY